MSTVAEQTEQSQHPPDHASLSGPLLMRQTLDGAIAAGVGQLLLIGTVYPYGRPQSDRVSEDHPREPHTFKGRMRKEQEDVLLAGDAAGLIRGAILKLPDFYGPHVERSFLYDAFQAAVKSRRDLTRHNFFCFSIAKASVLKPK